MAFLPGPLCQPALGSRLYVSWWAGSHVLPARTPALDSLACAVRAEVYGMQEHTRCAESSNALGAGVLTQCVQRLNGVT